MKWIYNDGGRSLYYKAQNVRDCVCRAIAIANDEDYKDWNRVLTKYAKLASDLRNLVE